MKTAGRVVVGLAAVVLVVVAAAGIYLRRSVPPLSGTETVPGLGAAVAVLWDSLGVPHITAQSDSDAFAALGYLHARDRLWQMETLRRAAEGRLAEVLGPAAVGADRFLRGLDIPRAARRSAALLPPGSRALVGAYLRGVNRWISGHTRPLGPEFLLLRFTPQPWTASQLVEIGRLMAWDLVNAGSELELGRAAASVGPDRVRDLFPTYPDSAPVILPRGSGHWRGTIARTHRQRGARPSSPVPSSPSATSRRSRRWRRRCWTPPQSRARQTRG